MKKLMVFGFCLVLLFLNCYLYGETPITGELMQWHKITLTFDGPSSSESGTPNPFLDYRLTVTFTGPAGQVYAIPGYFACDGNAANTSASSGSKWRAHLAADQAGTWTYAVAFRSGSGIAVSDVASEGASAGYMDGETGSFTVLPTNKTGRDNRARGRLEWVGGHILRFKGNGEYFLKQGADSPENLLAYQDFDGDFKTDGKKDSNVKTWSAHVGDWQTGDPVWQNTKGKGLIGAVNYLASKGLNAFSFLTNNINGDDQNVFMYTSYGERYRMDVSRMDQWEIVFEHADKKGMFLHFKTFETENDTLLDNGDTGPQRKLYYRELMARFGHHLALNWNLGEENAMSSPNQTTAQRRAMSNYWWDHDPYKHHQVIHNPIDPDDMLGSLSRLTGLSRQVGGEDFGGVYSDIDEWVKKSANAGRKWAIASDESGGASDGVRPVGDAGNSWVDGRKKGLWGTLMAGGWGNEYYFGYNHAHSDLTCQDFRSRDGFWDYCRFALSFFNCHMQDTFRKPVPVQSMAASNSRISNKTGSATWWCLSGKDSENKWAIVVYAQGSGGANIDVPAGALYNAGWKNAVNGQSLVQPNIVNHPGGNISVTNPFTDDAALLIYDWVAIEDTTPPTPNPMTWSVVPAATGPASITMTASTASDTSGVEYYFDETSGNPGGTDSGWRSNPTYTDTGLTGGQTYTYTVKARDTGMNLNETGVSIAQSATTPLPDTEIPTPNPAQWSVTPVAVDSDTITMTAVTGTDLQSPPVEYYFDETTGNPGGTDSGWQTSPTYTPTGLVPGTEYRYTVKMRDQQYNETLPSDAFTAFTHGDPDIVKNDYIDIADFASLAAQWLESNCFLSALCGGTDLNADGAVNLGDFQMLAVCWLMQTTPPGFQEVNGMIVIEAEHYDNSRPSQDGGNVSWELRNDVANPLEGTTSNGEYVYVGTNSISANYTTFGQSVLDNAPRLDYMINAVTGGTYYIWVRGNENAGNSLFLVADFQLTSAAVQGYGNWVWWNDDRVLTPAAQVTLTPGVHTISIYQREANCGVDKIVLTTNSGYIPSDFGPDESPR